MSILYSRSSSPLTGQTTVPGDKSISHRAVLLGGLSTGETTIDGLLESEDVFATIEAMRCFGCAVERSHLTHDTPGWRVQGLGVGGWQEPKAVLNFGNSGTGVRLVMGAMATTAITASFAGDASLSARPMDRVLTPLRLFGASFMGAGDGTRLPLTMIGAPKPMPVTYSVPVPSAQVKSAVLFAGLNAPGKTIVHESVKTRDHTERMLQAFGAELVVDETKNGGRTIELSGYAELRGHHISVPGDPSSAAFLVAAALLAPGSDLLVKNVLLNPDRTGFYKTVKEMGADLQIQDQRHESGESVADIRVKHSSLSAVDVPPERAPSMIDEYPILSVLAACADGTTHMSGIGELRVKESDRLSAIADGLAACGVLVEAGEDHLNVTGTDDVHGDCTIDSQMDHRVAMSFLVLGLVSTNPIAVQGCETIATSYPSFVETMTQIGATIHMVDAAS